MSHHHGLPIVHLWLGGYLPLTNAQEYIKSELEKNKNLKIHGCQQEPRIVEQQFGNFQNPHQMLESKTQRVKFGRFFFSFPDGEAGLDVYTRVTSFLSSLTRDFKRMRLHCDVEMKDLNVLIVTHGLTLRLFLMRYFQLSVEQFETTFNPPNGQLIVMERFRSDEYGWEYYKLSQKSTEVLNLKGRNVSSEDPTIYRDYYNLQSCESNL